MKEPKLQSEYAGRIPLVAIVGKPNAGKSTLFNRLIGKRLAIVSKTAGTTRDRLYHHFELPKLNAILVDTGGIEHGKKENIEADMQTQVKIAIQDADLIMFLVDSQATPTINDIEAGKLLKRSNKNILFVANKCDGNFDASTLSEYYTLGFDTPLQISAYHNTGIEELEQTIEKRLKKMGFKKVKEEKNPNEIKIAFIGRPNVGKSSLVNALLGKEKVIVSNIPGTTRDTTDTALEYEGQNYRIIDTAGIRRRGKIEPGIEKFSILRALQAIERADIVGLILDFEEGISKQDLHISSYATEAGKGLVLLINKCDLMQNRTEQEAETIREMRWKFDFLPWAPMIFMSALKRKNVTKVLEIAKEVMIERTKFISDFELGELMKEIIFKHPPPKVTKVRGKFYSLRQVKISPPTFIYSVNSPDSIHFSYKRYLENRLREKYGFTGTAIKLLYKKPDEIF